MNLELRDPGHPGESLKEILMGLAGELREDIARVADHPETRIHDIRVATKKIRALLRLAGPVVPPEESLYFAMTLREIRNTFAGSRDEAVMRKRLKELLPEDEAEAAITELSLAASGEDSLPPTESAADLAREVSERLEGLAYGAFTPALMLAQAAVFYRKSRKLMRKCRKSPDDERMHTWRKRTKDVCYHAYALSALKPMAKRVARLDTFAETLGDYHDFAVLSARAKGHQKIASIVSSRKKDLLAECFTQGKDLLDIKPIKFEKKLIKAMAKE